MDIGIIVAVSDNGVIGRDGKLPWNIPGDLRRFRELTLGHSVVMGRKTYESIGRPLPNRNNIVLSSSDIESVNVVGSLEEAFDVAEGLDSSRAYVIGGSSVYEEAMGFANFMEITEVHGNFEGDVYFPEFDWGFWKEIGRKTGNDCSFVSYIRK